jgi:LysM repeat protein
MDRNRLALAALVAVLIFGIFSGCRGNVMAAANPAPPYSPSEVLQLVNGLRAANDLPAYRANSALMAAAQAHSEYQASTGNASHTGKGGSRPHDRAVANGYGGGAAVSVSENIYSGSNASAAQAVGWWQGDSLHLGTMISASYRDAGAGMAQANGTTYFTLVVGYVSGQEGQPQAGQPPSDQTGSDGSPANPPGSTPAGTPAAWLMPIQAATPHADGMVVHEVQWGQFLHNIAEAYGVDLSYVLVLNGISADSVIYPGDKLLIRPAQPTATLAPSPTAASTEPPRFTETPTGSINSGLGVIQTYTPEPSGQETRAAADAISGMGAADLSAGDGSVLGEEGSPSGDQPAGEALSESLAAAPNAPARYGLDPVLAVIAGLVVLGTALLLLGSFVSRRM